ncbi:3CxxC-type zinc finger protein [Aspergillus fijiensis CBS 313.89]|uniref:3CxxC-type domain-containing protein n=1 Tax=Aspergillus fijiensis CBS 313.89 TaxID=1448319 RepID=A0A8G1RGB7_9EURO|nr:uncharacterized protein BO72DRAFT_454079 [Aspergillus fijiensis CBS 313.89]RAK70991.1 hypothetical protein BO72DRAFT_454079 [Aspergillus fijiensis CBS 313.89]
MPEPDRASGFMNTALNVSSSGSKPRGFKAKPAKRSRPQKPWSMYPALHEQVQALLDDKGLHFTFHTSDEDVGVVQHHDTRVMGRFVCRNASCQAGGWSSKIIAITVRMYSPREYNARVYHQHCRGCGSISRPVLDESSYAERIAYRLQKWSGIRQPKPKYFQGNSRRPHSRGLCEGCKAGHCIDGAQSQDDEDVDDLCTSMAKIL